MILIRDKETDAVILRMSRHTLEAADLRKRRLRYTDLTGINLRSANLHRADLWGADLRGADLRLANLREANLGGADFRHASLEGVEVTRARYNDRTRFPEGFRPDQYGMVREELPQPRRVPMNWEVLVASRGAL
jgi:hypothetical protein